MSPSDLCLISVVGLCLLGMGVGLVGWSDGPVLWSVRWIVLEITDRLMLA